MDFENICEMLNQKKIDRKIEIIIRLAERFLTAHGDRFGKLFALFAVGMNDLVVDEIVTTDSHKRLANMRAQQTCAIYQYFAAKTDFSHDDIIRLTCATLRNVR